MAPMIEHYNILTVLYWLVMFVVAVIVLVRVTGYFAGDTPGTLRRAALTTLLMGGAVYLTYDVSEYLLALLMQDPELGIQLPPQYSYWNWMSEPATLKWHALGFVPILRFVPVILALCVGCVIQVVLWDVPFNIGFLVFFAQLVLDLLAMVLLSFVFRLGIAMYERAAVASMGSQRMAEPAWEPGDAAARPATLYQLRQRVESLGDEEGPFWRRANARWEPVNGHLQPVYGLLQPITQHFPMPAQDVLNAGGWLVVLPGLGLLALFWPRIHRGRKHPVHRHKKHQHASGPQPRDELASIGDAMTALGPRQITVKGIPARLRLVVLAPASRQTGAIPPESHAELLDGILPGLGEILTFNFPRVEIWTDHHARDSFRSTLEEKVKFPATKGEPSRWLVLAGATSLAQGPVHCGLGLYTNEPTTWRIIGVSPGEWASTLSIREVSEIEGRS